MLKWLLQIGDFRKTCCFLTVVLYAVGASVHVVAGENVQDKTTIRVGAKQKITTISAAAATAPNGAVVEIDAGDYPSDTAVWTQAELTIRGVGGPVRLIAQGAHVEGKGIWVVRGGNIIVENIEFRGAKVKDKNGAGIRLEKGNLMVRNCAFLDNENGILTANNRDISLTIENSEFGHNGAGDGQSHNLYVGQIGRLTVRGSYFHHARVGHLLKSRAGENHILYNRLTDESEGRASYELEFPAGGIAYVIGNSIQQDSLSENYKIVSFGAEGYKWPTNKLVLSHNTIVNDRTKGGVFVFVRPGADLVRMVNNVFVGKASFEIPAAETVGETRLTWEDFHLPARFDYRLKPSSRAVGTATAPGKDGEVSLAPSHEYTHPRGTARLAPGLRLNPGAFQTVVK